MREFIICLFLLYSNFDSWCQIQSTSVVKEYLENRKQVDISDIDVLPKYPGGEEALFSFLSENVVYPESAKKDGIEGKVVVGFIVNQTGNIESVRVLHGVREDVDQEAVRVIKLANGWSPGFHNGKLISMEYMLPISFTLKELPRPPALGTNNDVLNLSDFEFKLYSDFWKNIYAENIPEATRILDLSEASKKERYWYYDAKGELAAREKDYQSAIKYRAKAVKIRGDIPELHFHLGLVYRWNGGYYTGAIEEFTTALELASWFTNVYYFRGMSYFDKGEYEGAKIDLIRVLNVSTNDYQIGRSNAFLSYIYAIQDSVDLSLNYSSNALEMDSTLSLAYYSRGYLFEQMGQVHKACLFYLKAKEYGMTIRRDFFIGKCQD